jgi:hypothetical protein
MQYQIAASPASEKEMVIAQVNPNMPRTFGDGANMLKLDLLEDLDQIGPHPRSSQINSI